MTNPRETTTTTDAADPTRAAEAAAIGLPWWRRGLAGWTLDLFSSVKFGIWLLVLLFLYSSIGSAGIVYPYFTYEGAGAEAMPTGIAWAHEQMRQWRPFELTEFEWFHWWPFDLMMILIAVNIVVTTLRRIPFKPVNYGVWMIHSGIIVLIVGSFIYFGTKVEGDAPVARRKVIATFPVAAADGSTRDERVEFLASPGIRAEAGEGAARTTFEVMSIDPAWEMLSGDAKGDRGYSVTVAVERDGKRFMRQLIAGRPEFTEDLIFTSDPQQPMKRAVKEIGSPIVDTALAMSLDYMPQTHFFLRSELVKSWALYVRPKGSTEWTERRIDGLPLYNDYVGDRSLVFQAAGEAPMPLHPIDLEVGPTGAADPFPDLAFRVTGYLRYAFPRSRWVEGDPSSAELNPVAFVSVASEAGQRAEYRLVARDPEMSKADGGLIRMVPIAREDEMSRFGKQPTIVVRIPGQSIEVRDQIREIAAGNPDAPFVSIAGSGVDGKPPYAYRVVNVRDEVPIAGRTVSLAIVEVRTPKGLFRRWVFDDPTLTRDVIEPDASDAHGAPKLEDDSIEVRYEPGDGLALVTLVHGPEVGRVRLVSTIGAAPVVGEMKKGDELPLAGGITVRLDDLLTRGSLEAKPFVVPKEQRERDAMEVFSQILLEAPGSKAAWIPFTRWVFDSPSEVLRRSPYEPRTVRLADGREVEVLFSRQRLPLGTDVALEEFVLSSHIGGFTGEQGSIRDYTSMLRFRDEGGSWSEPAPVSVNNPIAHNGLWFFQAQWDPPEDARREGERASRGLNYTVLGVGNRNGVYIQLLGCCIAVAGMLYAFYVKPVIKRRRQAEVLAGLRAGGAGRRGGEVAA